jgi:hypothetical protein
MKKLILNSLFFFGFLVILSNNLSAQNLQFNQVVYNTYGPGNADGNTLTPMFTGTLIVGPSQVLKITFTYATSLNAMQSGTQVVSGGVLLINDIMSVAGNDYWLPTGTYSVAGHEQAGFITSGSFKGMISGILYDIVP